jgi:hypothetical protein
MKFYKKILITIIIIIFLYILWRLLIKRAGILKEEHFTVIGSKNDNELSGLKDNLINMQIQGINTKYGDMPLREYCMKGSYNTAFTGNYINLDMIQYVVNRGCRFLDFEVFYIKENNLYIPKVGYTTDTTFTTLESENSILLDNILSSVVSSAFSPPCPNYQDPLFINLRIKSKNTDVYKAVAKSIDSTIRHKLYLDKSSSQTPYPAKKITNKTTLNNVMGKVIIVIDKTIIRDYRDYTTCDTNDDTCYDLKDYTNIESGSEEMNLMRYSDVMNQCIFPVNIKNDNLSTTIKTMKLTVPDLKNARTNNPVLSDFILSYGCQIVPYRFYKKDEQLENYEVFFNDNKTAFVPFAVAISYFQKKLDVA